MYCLLADLCNKMHAKAGSTRLYCWISQPFTNNRWQAELQGKGVFADSEVDVLQKVKHGTSTLTEANIAYQLGWVVNHFSLGQSATQDIVLLCVALMLGCGMISYDVWFHLTSYDFIETTCLDKSPRTKVSSAAGRELDLCRALLLPVPELQSVPISGATEIWGPAGSISSWGWYGQHRPKGVSNGTEFAERDSLKGRKELMLGGARGF